MKLRRAFGTIFVLAVLPGTVHSADYLSTAPTPLRPNVFDRASAVTMLMSSPSWTAESDQNNASFGAQVSTAGDVNGDGFSDVIVGAYAYDNGQTDEGRAFVYHGTAGGLESSVAWTAESDQAFSYFGISAATAGDVNGDGYDDVIVGAYTYKNGEDFEGRVYVYHGAASGLSVVPSWTAESNQAFAFFGKTVATAGDVNGDGYSDVIVGAEGYDNGQSDEGRACVYYGSSSGLGATPAWTAESNQAFSGYGYWVSTAGDVNGDGFSDVIVGANAYDNGQTDEGRAYVYHGSASGLAAAPAWTGESNQANSSYGSVGSIAGDVNGDGYCDVIVGAWRYDNSAADEGRAYAYYGSAAGLATSPSWSKDGGESNAYFGIALATAGDINEDGYADVVIGATTSGGGTNGAVFRYLGSDAGLSQSALPIIAGDQANASYGQSVATAGDVNGDGISDIIVGAFRYDNSQSDEGRAFVYHGANAGLALTATWTAEGNQPSPAFALRLGTAGDVNGDGYSDVIIGARAYDNDELGEGRALVYHGSKTGLVLMPSWIAESDVVGSTFGEFVATAGDVNGDGYSDVIVGAPLYDNDQDSEGRAFVYHGSAAGLASAPAWTAEGDTFFTRFGYSVTSAGDVNGDGYSDVIVGQPFFGNGQNNEGRALVYHGSPIGLPSVPSWTAESDQDGAVLGATAATAGDVNGDGYSDIIIGAEGYDNGLLNVGRVLVYHGSAAGLAPTPAWSVEGEEEFALFGDNVSTAGDVNGDGFSDIIVGKPDGAGEEGAFVYHGSESGLSLSPVWSATNSQANEDFGYSVATAGDVNADGYSDVIIGAPQYDNGAIGVGRARVYQGSETGLALIPAWTAESGQGGALFGTSVAPAGDVDGDGYSDVIVGAILYENGQTDEGAAFVYHGNNGGGLDRIARQGRADTSAPIAILGRSESVSEFRLNALGRTPAGRGEVRIQHEVKASGLPFDGSDLATGPFTDTGTPGGSGSVVALSELVSGLDPSTLYHWRLRLLSNSPFFPRSRWLWMPDNAVTEADVRTAPAGTTVSDLGGTSSSRLLEPSVPNPFVSVARLAYTLPERGRVRLAVYDVSGRRVALLADDVQDAGRHEVRWDSRDVRGVRLPRGVYLARIEFGGRVESRKLVLAR